MKILQRNDRVEGAKMSDAGRTAVVCFFVAAYIVGMKLVAEGKASWIKDSELSHLKEIIG